MAFSLGDDGTMDTVLICDECGKSDRYGFDGCEQQKHEAHPEDCVCYAQFVTWAKHDAQAYHE